MDPEAEIDRLFAGPPEAFVAERDALAKRLKDGGRAADAAEVRSFRRPTVTAWAINRLARERPKEVGDLLKVAADLRTAQRGALAGVRGSALREGIRRRRVAVDALVDAATGLLDASGRSGATHREAIARTLEAATADAEAAESVRAGRLERELTASGGFGDVHDLVPSASSPAGRARAAAGTTAKPARPAKEDPRVRRLRTERDAAADEARRAAREAVRAGERAVAADREAERAAAEIDRLERNLRTARRRERDAVQSATAARAALKKAEGSAERARKRVEDLQARLERQVESR